MKKFTKLWLSFLAIITVSFSVLGYFGLEIYRQAPPIPAKVLSADGSLVFSKQDIQEGQQVWQSIGGQELGSIWGHGSYVAPDWNADWIHKEALFILNAWSRQHYKQGYDDLDEEKKALLEARLQKHIRTNSYDEKSQNLRVSAIRRQAIASNSRHYASLFSDDPKFDELRENYAIRKNTLSDPQALKKLNAFFFWTSWACVTERPGHKITYTHNWPGDKLVGNEPTGSLILWTGFSIIMLLLGIGLLAFYHARRKDDEIDQRHLPKKDPLQGLNPTPSMRATPKVLLDCRSFDRCAGYPRRDHGALQRRRRRFVRHPAC